MNTPTKLGASRLARIRGYIEDDTRFLDLSDSLDRSLAFSFIAGIAHNHKLSVRQLKQVAESFGAINVPVRHNTAIDHFDGHVTSMDHTAERLGLLAAYNGYHGQSNWVHYIP